MLKCDSVSQSVVVAVRLTEMDETRVSARARVTIVPAPEFWQMMEFCQAQDQLSDLVLGSITSQISPSLPLCLMPYGLWSVLIPFPYCADQLQTQIQVVLNRLNIVIQIHVIVLSSLL